MGKWKALQHRAPPRPPPPPTRPTRSITTSSRQTWYILCDDEAVVIFVVKSWILRVGVTKAHALVLSDYSVHIQALNRAMIGLCVCGEGRPDGKGELIKLPFCHVWLMAWNGSLVNECCTLYVEPMASNYGSIWLRIRSEWTCLLPPGSSLPCGMLVWKLPFLTALCVPWNASDPFKERQMRGHGHNWDDADDRTIVIKSILIGLCQLQLAPLATWLFKVSFSITSTTH